MKTLTIDASSWAKSSFFNLNQKKQSGEVKKDPILSKSDDELDKDGLKRKKQAQLRFEQEAEIKRLRETADEIRQNDIADKIAEKLAKGEQLTAQEEQYIKQPKYKHLYDDAVNVRNEVKNYENQIKNARTDERVQQVLSLAKKRIHEESKAGRVKYAELLSKAVLKVEEKYNNNRYHYKDAKGNLKPKAEQNENKKFTFSITI